MPQFSNEKNLFEIGNFIPDLKHYITNKKHVMQWNSTTLINYNSMQANLLM